MTAQETNDGFQFYLRFAKPLVLNLASPKGEYRFEASLLPDCTITHLHTAFRTCISRIMGAEVEGRTIWNRKSAHRAPETIAIRLAERQTVRSICQ